MSSRYVLGLIVTWQLLGNVFICWQIGVKKALDFILNCSLGTDWKMQQFSFSINRLDKRNDLLVPPSVSSQTTTQDAGGWHRGTKLQHGEPIPLVQSCYRSRTGSVKAAQAARRKPPNSITVTQMYCIDF